MGKSLVDLFAEIRGGTQEWLLLFDIDGTLVDTGGKGMRALMSTAAQVFRSEAPSLDLAGSTDLGVLDGLYRHYKVLPDKGVTGDFFGSYHIGLKESLEENTDEGRVLDGVEELLETLQTYRHVQLGLLTGNTEEGARIKLTHYGLNSFFAFGAYGSDQADRNVLGSIALQRATESTGKNFTPETTLVIGDTPKDVACAHTFGAKCLAVATGKFSSEDLKNARADWVVGSLKEVNAYLRNV